MKLRKFQLRPPIFFSLPSLEARNNIFRLLMLSISHLFPSEYPLLIKHEGLQHDPAIPDKPSKPIYKVLFFYFKNKYIDLGDNYYKTFSDSIFLQFLFPKNIHYGFVDLWVKLYEILRERERFDI